MTVLSQVGEFLAHHCGFEAPDLRTLRKAVEQRAHLTGLASAAQYAEFLTAHPHELTELINLVVVPETFFFRYPATFRALAHWAAQRPVRPIRLLSLACSTGEEPYSMAMTLLDAGLEEADFVIEARDISTAAIAAGRHGIYGPKSFREMEGDWRHRYFSAEGPEWKISPRLRRTVSFHHANLLQLADHAAWDVIFCRNSLIYFPPVEQRKVAGHIDRALAEDGILFLGPAEPPLFIDSGWAPSGYAMSFSCLRRPAKRAPIVRKSPPKPLAVAKPALPKAAKTASRVVPPPASPPEIVSLDEARALADAGRLDDAQRLLSAALKSAPSNAEAYFLQGVVEEARGHLDLAETNYRKTIYLQPSHTEALQHMTLLFKSQGRTQAASHLHRRASRHTTG